MTNSPIMRQFRAGFCRALATGAAVDAGSGISTERYTGRARQQVGPIVQEMRRAKLIVKVGGCHASRPSRKGSVNWLWQAVDVLGVLRLAEVDEQWLAEHSADTEPASGPRQLSLF